MTLFLPFVSILRNFSQFYTGFSDNFLAILCPFLRLVNIFLNFSLSIILHFVFWNFSPFFVDFVHVFIIFSLVFFSFYNLRHFFRFFSTLYFSSWRVRKFRKVSHKWINLEKFSEPKTCYKKILEGCYKNSIKPSILENVGKNSKKPKIWVKLGLWKKNHGRSKNDENVLKNLIKYIKKYSRKIKKNQEKSLMRRNISENFWMIFFFRIYPRLWYISRIFWKVHDFFSGISPLYKTFSVKFNLLELSPKIPH